MLTAMPGAMGIYALGGIRRVIELSVAAWASPKLGSRHFSSAWDG
jgi:hypothetical protein